MNRPALIIFLASSFVSVGCKRPHGDRDDHSLFGKIASASKKLSDPTPAGAKIEWKEDNFTISGMKVTGHAIASGVKYSVSIEGLPEGTKVKVGDNEETANAYYSGTLDLGDAIGQAAPSDALDYQKKIDPKARVEITFPDGVKISSPLPPIAVKFGLEEALKNLKNGTPVLFGKESDAKPAAHTILWPMANSIQNEGLFGPAKTMHDVDLIASEEGLPIRSGNKKCPGYKEGSEAGPGRTLDLTLQDWDVSLIERKTGKVIDKKKFEAETTCPFSALGDTATSYPSWDAVKAWLRTERSKA